MSESQSSVRLDGDTVRTTLTTEQIMELRELLIGADESCADDEMKNPVMDEFNLAAHTAFPALLDAAEAVAAMERWGLKVRWVEDGHHAGWLVTDSVSECDMAIEPTFTAAVLAAARWLESNQQKGK